MKPRHGKELLGACCALVAFGSGSLTAHETNAPAAKTAPAAVATFNNSFFSSPLVNKVRRATERYRDINVAISEQWVAATPCVSGPNEGAMGVHYVLPSRLGDGILNPEEPEALIYEPQPGGRMRLVGVEFIELQDAWDTKHPNDQPMLDGHLLHLVTGPNRYRLPPFYEMHVWAFERNPNGNFADWNTDVSCDRQPAP
jgi:hypothetical protein